MSLQTYQQKNLEKILALQCELDRVTDELIAAKQDLSITYNLIMDYSHPELMKKVEAVLNKKHILNF